MPSTLSPLTVALRLEQASVIIDEALRLARQHDMAPLTAAVLDAGGHQLALKREDGSGIIRVQVAIAKAYGALGMGVSSRVIGERLAARPNDRGGGQRAARAHEGLGDGEAEARARATALLS